MLSLIRDSVFRQIANTPGCHKNAVWTRLLGVPLTPASIRYPYPKFRTGQRNSDLLIGKTGQPCKHFPWRFLTKLMMFLASLLGLLHAVLNLWPR